ncbi:hypothetical protein C8F04DRAFT_1395775, partial [Mycena alexandri]
MHPTRPFVVPAHLPTHAPTPSPSASRQRRVDDSMERVIEGHGICGAFTSVALPAHSHPFLPLHTTSPPPPSPPLRFPVHIPVDDALRHPAAATILNSAWTSISSPQLPPSARCCRSRVRSVARHSTRYRLLVSNARRAFSGGSPLSTISRACYPSFLALVQYAPLLPPPSSLVIPPTAAHSDQRLAPLVFSTPPTMQTRLPEIETTPPTVAGTPVVHDAAVDEPKLFAQMWEQPSMDHLRLLESSTPTPVLSRAYNRYRAPRKCPPVPALVSVLCTRSLRRTSARPDLHAAATSPCARATRVVGGGE